MNSFSFFHPEYLWALVFLIIPLILHFLRQRRILKLNFSSTRFLKDIAVKANQINRLKKILLLITRLLMVMLLILIFAQPYNKKNPFRIITGSNTALYCWVDPTMSMSYTHKGLTLRQHACNHVSYIDSILPGTSEIYCYDGSIHDFTSIQSLSSSRMVTEVCTPLRHGQTDVHDMILKFLKNKNNDTRTPMLLLFSDFASKDKALFEDLINASNSTFPILCINMADENPWNYTIDNPYILFENKPSINCTIKSAGHDLQHGEVIVELESMRAGRKPVTLKKNDSLNISIDMSQNSRIKRGNLQLKANDPYLIDNITFFLPNTIKRKKILVISDSEEALPIAAVFQSISSAKWFPPVVKKSLHVSFNDLDSSDIIVLSSIKEPTEILSGLWGKTGLSEKLILFSPYIGDLSNSLNALLFPFLQSPSKVTKIIAVNPLFPLLPDTVSSLWQGFPRFVDRDVSIYNYFAQIPGTPLLLLNNGSPLVTHMTDTNKNSWLLFASPINITNANNMCETGFYAPVMDRIVNYGMKSLYQVPQDWIAGIPQSNPFAGTRSSAMIYDSDNKSIAFWDRQTQVVFDNPGLYKIQPNNKSAYWIAVNVDPVEGNLNYETPKVLESSKKYVKIITGKSFNSFVTQYKSYSNTILWIILMLCILLEILLWIRK